MTRTARLAAPAAVALVALPAAVLFGQAPAAYTASRPRATLSEAEFQQRRELEYYEYACHEGNNAMRNILSGARAAEK
jgi:hypothetical protein